MSRAANSPFSCLLLGCFLVILTIAAPAQADYVTYRIDATPTIIGQGGGWGGFSLAYIDQDDDGRFSVKDDQLLSFSGVSLTGYPLFSVLTGAAGYNDTLYTDEIGTGSNPGYRSWTFENSDGSASGAAFCWDYQQSTVQSAVPLPPTAFLLGAGLMSLFWARRKRLLEK